MSNHEQPLCAAFPFWEPLMTNDDDGAIDTSSYDDEAFVRRWLRWRLVRAIREIVEEGQA